MSLPTSGPTKVVAAFLDGRRLKGFVFNFSASRKKFELYSSESAKAHEVLPIELRELKAIFFVKEFEGLQEDKPAPASPLAHGRRIEVFFADGERLAGATEGYDPNRPGFFLSPTNPASNILRIFVVNANVKRVQWT